MFKFLKTTEMQDIQDRNVPDGGWGWIIVIGTLAFNAIYDGCSFSFGILYTDLLDYFEDTKSNTAWMGSLFFAVPMLCAPLAGMITKRIGSRNATMLGGLIASIAFALASLSSSVWMLTLFYGLIGGFGISLPYFNSLKIVTDYFDKRLALASGIAECGAGLGTLIFAPLTEYLVTQFGWRGTLLILSGIVLNIVVCGALYQPIEKTNDAVVKKKKEQKMELEIENGDSCKTFEGKSNELTSGTNKCSKANLKDKTISKELRPIIRCNFFQMLNVPFVIFAISNFVLYFWYDVPYVFMVDRSTHYGIPAQKASFLLSIIGIFHVLGILGCGFLGDRNFMNLKLLFGMSTVFCGVSISLVPLAEVFSFLAVLSGCFGIFSAAMDALLSCILIDIVGKKAFDNFMCGIILFIEGLANLIGPPFAGFLFDLTGNYDTTFYTAGAFVITAGVLYVTFHKVRTVTYLK